MQEILVINFSKNRHDRNLPVDHAALPTLTKQEVLPQGQTLAEGQSVCV
jgi:hypothetical protein